MAARIVVANRQLVGSHAGGKARIQAENAVDDAPVARGGLDADSSGAVGVHNLAEPRGNLVDSLIPANALPFSRSTLAHATHRRLNTVRIVDSVQIRQALQAAARIALHVVLGRAKLHQLAVALRGSKAATAVAVRTAMAVEDLVFGSRRIAAIGHGKTLESTGSHASCSQGARGETRRFQEAATCHVLREARLLLLHLHPFLFSLKSAFGLFKASPF